MRKRRKVLVILGLIALAAVCFVMLRSRDEPKYQGRYLSEWMASYDDARRGADIVSWPEGDKSLYLSELADAELAVRAIGTNALPYFIKWMKHSQAESRFKLVEKLPSRLGDNRLVQGWFLGPARSRHRYGFYGILILGSNAVDAIPELSMMMYDRTKPRTADAAISALAGIGEQAIPTMKAALADTNVVDRWGIVYGFLHLVYDGHTNTCLPLIIEALHHEDDSVRDAATNVLLFLAPQSLTNFPAQ